MIEMCFGNCLLKSLERNNPQLLSICSDKIKDNFYISKLNFDV